MKVGPLSERSDERGRIRRVSWIYKCINDFAIRQGGGAPYHEVRRQIHGRP
jgi:hypothetical protein